MAGQFIDPDPSLQDCSAPHEQLGVRIYSGFQAIKHADRFRGKSRIFDDIADRMRVIDMPYEDQCSIDYYFDLARVLRDFHGEFDRVVEVGTYMGGASALLAGCVEKFDFDLDLVDPNPAFLRFSFERIRRAFPEAANRVRLFQGDLPAYVQHVMRKEPPCRAVIQHDGAHDFNQVVTDLTALSFVKDQLHAIIAQDTHLRGTLEFMNFVDLALTAMFGKDLNYMPIGAVYSATNPITQPNRFQGNYFLPDVAEGMVMPMSVNTFQYPHETMTFDDMFGSETDKQVPAAVAA